MLLIWKWRARGCSCAGLCSHRCGEIFNRRDQLLMLRCCWNLSSRAQFTASLRAPQSPRLRLVHRACEAPTARVRGRVRRGGVARVARGWLLLGTHQNRTWRVALWDQCAEESAFRSARMGLVCSPSEQLSRGGFVTFGLFGLSRQGIGDCSLFCPVHASKGFK